MDRERLRLLTRRKLGTLTAGALSASVLDRIESVERRLAGAEAGEGPSAVRHGRRRRRRKTFLQLGEAGGDIHDLMVKRHRIVRDGSGAGAPASGWDGVIVDHDHHDAESLASLEPMLDAYHAGVPVLFLNARADLLEQVHLPQFVAVRVEDMPAYALMRLGNGGSASERPCGYGIGWQMTAGMHGDQTVDATWVTKAFGDDLFSAAFDGWMQQIVQTGKTGAQPGGTGPARESKSGGSRAQVEIQTVKVRITPVPHSIYGAKGWSGNPTCGGRYPSPHETACFDYLKYCYYRPLVSETGLGLAAVNDVTYWMTSLVALDKDSTPLGKYNVYTSSEIVAQVDPNHVRKVRTSKFKVKWSDKYSRSCPEDRWEIRDDQQGIDSLLGYHMLARFAARTHASDDAPPFLLFKSLPLNANGETNVIKGSSRTQGYEVGTSIGFEGEGPVASLSGSFHDEWGWSNDVSINVEDWFCRTNQGESEFWVANKYGGNYLPTHFNNIDDLRDTSCGDPGFCGRSRITIDFDALNRIQRGQLAFGGESYSYSTQKPTGSGTLEVMGTAAYVGGAASWVADLKHFSLGSEGNHIGSYAPVQQGASAELHIPVKFDLSAKALNFAEEAQTFSATLEKTSIDKKDDWSLVRLQVTPKASTKTASYRSKIYISPTLSTQLPLPLSQIKVLAVKLVNGAVETDVPNGVDLFNASKPIDVPAGLQLAVDFKCLHDAHNSYSLKAVVNSSNPEESPFNRVRPQSPTIG